MDVDHVPTDKKTKKMKKEEKKQKKNSKFAEALQAKKPVFDPGEH